MKGVRYYFLEPEKPADTKEKHDELDADERNIAIANVARK